MISDPADLRTIQKQEKALQEAHAEITKLRAEESHRVMCLQAEVTARNAANALLREKVDILEEGLNQAKAQIALLERVASIRRDAEPAPGGSGE